MLLRRRVLEAVTSGLLVALLAPPIAAAVFLVSSAVSTDLLKPPFDANPVSILLLFIGASTATYFLGAIPAFLAGLALPTLRRRLSPVLASAATGLAAVLAYALTFGSHLLAGPRPAEAVVTYALPAFTGVAVAAFLALRIEKRYVQA